MVIPTVLMKIVTMVVAVLGEDRSTDKILLIYKYTKRAIALIKAIAS